MNAAPQHQPTAAPRTIPNQARWSTERTPAELRELKFRFDLPAAVIKKHVGESALAIIHAVERVARKNASGKFWHSAANLAANAKTQDGSRLSIKQVRRGLARAEQAGLIGPGAWFLARRKGKNEWHYTRELLCWPEPRWAGRCYGVTNTTKRKVMAMAGHGGKRKGSGKKVGSKERDPEAANAKRRAAYWSNHVRPEDTLWSHGFEAEPRSTELRAEYGLAPLTPEQLRALEAAPHPTSPVPSTCELVVKRRGCKSVVNQVGIVNQVGTCLNQGGSLISSLREDKEALRSSFGRTDAAAIAAAVVSLVSKPEPTPPEQGTESVASPGKRERLEDLVKSDPVLGTCVSPPPPFRWNEPRHLMPPFPTSDRFPTTLTPNPPKLPEEMPEDDRVELMAAGYRGAVRATYKKPPPMSVLDKSGRDKKLRAAMKKCAVALQDHDIAPAAWALFSCEVWRENNSTRRPPPQAWVWLESRVDTHHGWFRHGWRGNDIGHRVLMGEAAREAMRRWSELQNELRGARAMTPETVAPIVAKWFPDGTYDHLKERAAFEAKRTQRDLNERALAGEWVY